MQSEKNASKTFTMKTDFIRLFRSLPDSKRIALTNLFYHYVLSEEIIFNDYDEDVVDLFNKVKGEFDSINPHLFS